MSYYCSVEYGMYRNAVQSRTDYVRRCGESQHNRNKIVDADYNIISKNGKCHMCDGNSNLYDLDYKKYFCSVECLQKIMLNHDSL